MSDWMELGPVTLEPQRRNVKLVVGISDGYNFHERESWHHGVELARADYLRWFQAWMAGVEGERKSGEFVKSVEIWERVHEGVPGVQLKW